MTNDTVNGGYLVTWSDDRNIDGLAIYGQLVSAEGEFKGTEILIASGLFRGQVPSSYSVTYDYVNQRFLVVWISVQSIHGQFINANGTLQGEEFTIVEDPGEGFYPIGQSFGSLRRSKPEIPGGLGPALWLGRYNRPTGER